MKKRNSMIFGKKTELKNDIELKIITRFPEKWILIDSETSQVYSGNNNLKIGHLMQYFKLFLAFFAKVSYIWHIFVNFFYLDC